MMVRAIPTLEKTLADQDDLDQLCSDRLLKTEEVFAPNAFYGNSSILKSYAELPQAYPLKVVIPHAPYLYEDHIWEAEREAHVPAIYCYSSFREPVCIQATNKVVLRAASPFLYLLRLLKGQPPLSREGTIFFPSHSTHHITVQMDFNALAEELAQLDDEYQPITVCVYWRDFNLGNHIPFKNRGFRIVSAGQLYDPDFLYRFYHLCSIHRYAASNSLGTPMLYSVKAGCSYFHFSKIPHSLAADEQILKRDILSPSPARMSALESLFSQPHPSMTAEQIGTVDDYLGADHLKTPHELRRQLLSFEVFDKAGFIVRQRDGTVRFSIPTCYRRSGRAWKRRLGGLKHRLLRLSGRAIASLRTQ